MEDPSFQRNALRTTPFQWSKIKYWTDGPLMMDDTSIVCGWAHSDSFRSMLIVSTTNTDRVLCSGTADLRCHSSLLMLTIELLPHMRGFCVVCAFNQCWDEIIKKFLTKITHRFPRGPFVRWPTLEPLLFIFPHHLVLQIWYFTPNTNMSFDNSWFPSLCLPRNSH